MSLLLTPKIEWRGRLPYDQVLREQRARRELIIHGKADECIWALEHEPVITTGRRAVHDLPNGQQLAERGVALVHTERGGLATYHGPGQLVGYFLLNVVQRNVKVRELIYGIEEGVIRWLTTQDVAATRRCGYPGVWVDEGKICSIGMHFRRGVSMHGFALNLHTNLDGFDLITPCGIEDARMTSLLAISRQKVMPGAVAVQVIHTVMDCLQLTPGSCTDKSVGLPGM